MAHPKAELKRTDHVNFGKALDGIPKEQADLVHDCTRKRQGIEEALKHLDGSSETIVGAVQEYATMRVTLDSLVRKARSSSRLRFKWTNMLEEDKTVSHSVDFDAASMLVAAGLWHMQHAHSVKGSIKDAEEDEEQMKEMLHSLKTAAGLFECVRAWPNLAEGHKDLGANTTKALSLQSRAEAQSVTIRRAISKGHKPSLIGELCCDVSTKYKMAAEELDKSNHLIQKWTAYLKYQAELYLALSRCFQGVHLLENEDKEFTLYFWAVEYPLVRTYKCGDSIVVLNESLKHIQQASALAKEYDKEKPKSKVYLDESPDFVKVKKLINEKKAKSDRENGMIYHQRLPEECPALYEPKCLVQPTPFELPQAEDLTERPVATDEPEPETPNEAGTDENVSPDKDEEDEDEGTSASWSPGQ